MKRLQFFLLVLVSMCFPLQGCVGLMFDAAMESAGVSMGPRISLAEPSLTENSPLSSIQSLNICILKFKDERNVSPENKVGSITTLGGFSSGSYRPIIANNVKDISSFVTQTIADEFKRNNHTVVIDNNSCDFIINGKINKFWIDFSGTFKKKCNGIIEVSIEVQKKKDNKVLLLKTYSGSISETAEGYPNVPNYLIERVLNETLFAMMKNFSQDPALLMLFREYLKG